MGESLIDSGVAGAQIQRRSGGTIGVGVTGVFGILGYKNSANNNFGVYSTSALGTGTGRMAGNNSSPGTTPNAGIGIGAIGGVMGGYIKGEQYGFVSKGETFGAYIMGNTFTNKPITQIETIDNNKVISYVATSTTVDITTRGKGQLTNGKGYVVFDKAFTQLADLSDENLNITITAKGNTNGIYIENITRDGFYVKENMDGNHTVAFNWSAISVKKAYKDGIEVSKEILDPNWEIIWMVLCITKII
ncbi:MAG: hypothetical protein HC854_08220 [Flavobacterium sp.]|nr:hypothetical protein [Flavobacterium sp.]